MDCAINYEILVLGTLV